MAVNRSPALTSIPHDDDTYTGEVSTSPVSLDYFRDKAREFQVVLSALDEAAQVAQSLIFTDLSPEFSDYVDRWLSDFSSKRARLKWTAEGINAASAVINSAGGRFPVLSIPGTLGAPFVIPLAGIAAISAAVVLGVWGSQAVSGLNDRWKLEIELNAQTTPEGRAALAAGAMRLDAANSTIMGSIFGGFDMGSIVKIAIVGAVGFYLYKLYKGSKKGK